MDRASWLQLIYDLHQLLHSLSRINPIPKLPVIAINFLEQVDPDLTFKDEFLLSDGHFIRSFAW